MAEAPASGTVVTWNVRLLPLSAKVPAGKIRGNISNKRAGHSGLPVLTDKIEDVRAGTAFLEGADEKKQVGGNGTAPDRTPESVAVTPLVSISELLESTMFTDVVRLLLVTLSRPPARYESRALPRSSAFPILMLRRCLEI